MPIILQKVIASRTEAKLKKATSLMNEISKELKPVKTKKAKKKS